MAIKQELLQLAETHRDTPLEILGYQIDKSDPAEVYGALVWIEEQLHVLLEHERNG